MWFHLFAQINIPTPTPIPQGTPAVPLTNLPSGNEFAADLSMRAVNMWQSFFSDGMIVTFQLAIIIILIIGGIVLISNQLSDD